VFAFNSVELRGSKFTDCGKREGPHSRIMGLFKGIYLAIALGQELISQAKS